MSSSLIVPHTAHIIKSNMWNVHIWDVHMGVVAAAAATMHAINIMCICSCSGQKFCMPTHPPVHQNSSTRMGKLTRRYGNRHAALRQEWLRPLWLPSPVARWLRPRRLPSHLPHIIIKTSSNHIVLIPHIISLKAICGTSTYGTSTWALLPLLL